MRWSYAHGTTYNTLTPCTLSGFAPPLTADDGRLVTRGDARQGVTTKPVPPFVNARSEADNQAKKQAKQAEQQAKQAEKQAKQKQPRGKKAQVVPVYPYTRVPLHPCAPVNFRRLRAPGRGPRGPGHSPPDRPQDRPQRQLQVRWPGCACAMGGWLPSSLICRCRAGGAVHGGVA